MSKTKKFVRRGKRNTRRKLKGGASFSKLIAFYLAILCMRLFFVSAIDLQSIYDGFKTTATVLKATTIDSITGKNVAGLSPSTIQFMIENKGLKPEEVKQIKQIRKENLEILISVQSFVKKKLEKTSKMSKEEFDNILKTREAVLEKIDELIKKYNTTEISREIPVSLKQKVTKENQQQMKDELKEFLGPTLGKQILEGLDKKEKENIDYLRKIVNFNFNTQDLLLQLVDSDNVDNIIMNATGSVNQNEDISGWINQTPENIDYSVEGPPPTGEPHDPFANNEEEPSATPTPTPTPIATIVPPEITKSTPTPTPTPTPQQPNKFVIYPWTMTREQYGMIKEQNKWKPITNPNELIVGNHYVVYEDGAIRTMKIDNNNQVSFYDKGGWTPGEKYGSKIEIGKKYNGEIYDRELNKQGGKRKRRKTKRRNK